MEKNYEYVTKGTCSRKIKVTLDGETVKEVIFEGGCNGNTKGIASLVKGMNAKELIQRTRGIKCGLKDTSCPDQLSYAVEEALNA